MLRLTILGIRRKIKYNMITIKLEDNDDFQFRSLPVGWVTKMTQLLKMAENYVDELRSLGG